MNDLFTLAVCVLVCIVCWLVGCMALALWIRFLRHFNNKEK